MESCHTTPTLILKSSNQPSPVEFSLRPLVRVIAFFNVLNRFIKQIFSCVKHFFDSYLKDSLAVLSRKDGLTFSSEQCTKTMESRFSVNLSVL